jgi:hypothetical protein
MSADATTKPAPIPARHTLITLGIAVQRALEAWDSTVLPAARDGDLQEAMESLRAAAQDFSLTTDYAIQVTSKTGPCWLFTHAGTHCITEDVRKCDRFDTADLAEQFAAPLRWNYPSRQIAVRAVPKREGNL